MNKTAANTCRITTTFLLLAMLAACQVNTVQTPAEVSSAPIRAPAGERIASNEKPSPASRTTELSGQQPAPGYDNLWLRIADGLDLQAQYQHPSIDRELEWYLDHPRYIERITARAAPFLFAIVEEVQQRQLPLELALLPVVESAFDPKAYSPEHAAGLWQFIPATARSYGLAANWWYDGRRDPLSSTRAALDYLEFLRDKFEGDWLLAIAAYNAGEGNVRRALRRGGQTASDADFWTLRLPAETRGHVPKLLAISRVIADAEQYGIELPALGNEPYLERVELDFQLDLATAAQIAGVDEQLFLTLNAGYLQWATHPENPQSLVFPSKNAQLFRDAIAAMPVDQRVVWDYYQIRRGDTLGAIARRFNTRVDVLQSVNDLRGTSIIAGDSLIIPRAGANAAPAALTAASSPRRSIPIPTSYRVRSGDSLWQIARRFDLKSRDIAAWNGIGLDSVLHPGQMLTLHSTSYLAAIDLSNADEERRFNYSVVRGDSLDRIARQFRVTIADLVSWNNLDPGALIFPGQELLVIIPATEVN
jgi:membrane-bound lytic murein transglycosylase D